jgi:hypothetical protein
MSGVVAMEVLSLPRDNFSEENNPMLSTRLGLCLWSWHLSPSLALLLLLSFLLGEMWEVMAVLEGMTATAGGGIIVVSVGG